MAVLPAICLPLSSPSSHVAGPFIILPLTQSSPQLPLPSMLIHTPPQPTHTPPPQPLGSPQMAPIVSDEPPLQPTQTPPPSFTDSLCLSQSQLGRQSSLNLGAKVLDIHFLFNDAFFHDVSDPTVGEMKRPSSNPAPLPLESTRSNDQEMGSPSFGTSHGNQQSTEYISSKEHLGNSSESSSGDISSPDISSSNAPDIHASGTLGPIIANVLVLMEVMFEDEESQSMADWGGSQVPLSIVGPSDEAPIKCRKAITHCNIPAHTCIPVVTVCRAVKGSRVQSLSIVMFSNHQ
ncbi:hypothetical protein ARMGADRAFT_1071416 [Armillaria gallica]|uniref:Uncharacterized protein n=1 Tax=Armillaria gallica TaxID=47427 RepID=A0A2H3E3A2_ARMGA|nr:hypothetical protein ARMGADRAFT_1071416 [Armillaria gallica]